MTEFKKGDWAICQSITLPNQYVQIIEPANGKKFVDCRVAGQKEIVQRRVSSLIPASITPNFNDAKAGDECFSVEEGICKIMDGKSDSLIAAMNKDGGWDAFTKDGKLEPESTHPLLFNSFAQFQAYWAEQALLMTTQRRKA